MDDDGNLGGSQMIDAANLKLIQELIDETKTDTREFCDLFGIASLPELPLFRGGQAIMLLKTKKSGKKLSDVAHEEI